VKKRQLRWLFVSEIEFYKYFFYEVSVWLGSKLLMLLIDYFCYILIYNSLVKQEDLLNCCLLGVVGWCWEENGVWWSDYIVKYCWKI